MGKMSSRIYGLKVSFILLAFLLGACFLSPRAGGQTTPADGGPSANVQERSIVYTHEVDGQLCITRYPLDQGVTEEIGTIPASEPNKTPTLAFLPNRGVLFAAGARSESVDPKPAKYLYWRTLTLFDPKDVPQAESNPIVIGYWDGSWLLGVEETEADPAVPRARLIFDRGEGPITVGHVYLNRSGVVNEGPYAQWSPDGRFFTWFDEGEAHWLDMATGRHGSAGTGNFLQWLLDSRGFIFCAYSGREHSIAWRVQWLLGPNAGQCLEGSRNGLPIRVSPDSRFVALTTDEFPNPLRRVVPIPGAESAETSTTPITSDWGEWLVAGNQVRYVEAAPSRDKWFAITPDGFEAHGVAQYHLPDYALERVEAIAVGNGGCLGIVFEPKSDDVGPRGLSVIVVTDLQGREILRANDVVRRATALGDYVFLGCMDGEQSVVKRFDLTSGDSVVVLRGARSSYLRSVGDNLVAFRLSPSPSPLDKSKLEPTDEILLSSDLGATWTQIADKVLYSHVCGDPPRYSPHIEDRRHWSPPRE